MTNLREQYNSLKATAINLMGTGELNAYLGKLKEMEMLKLQIIQLQISPK